MCNGTKVKGSINQSTRWGSYHNVFGEIWEFLEKQMYSLFNITCSIIVISKN